MYAYNPVLVELGHKFHIPATDGVLMWNKLDDETAKNTVIFVEDFIKRKFDPKTMPVDITVNKGAPRKDLPDLVIVIEGQDIDKIAFGNLITEIQEMFNDDMWVGWSMFFVDGT